MSALQLQEKYQEAERNVLPLVQACYELIIQSAALRDAANLKNERMN